MPIPGKKFEVRLVEWFFETNPCMPCARFATESICLMVLPGDLPSTHGFACRVMRQEHRPETGGSALLSWKGKSPNALCLAYRRSTACPRDLFGQGIGDVIPVPQLSGGSSSKNSEFCRSGNKLDLTVSLLCGVGMTPKAVSTRVTEFHFASSEAVCNAFSGSSEPIHINNQLPRERFVEVVPIALVNLLAG